MAQSFLVSPGINVTEYNISNIIPSVATTDGAIGGIFKWGPIGEQIVVDSETNLVKRFGPPANFNAETWFTAADFLAYGDTLHVSRAAETSGIGNLNIVDTGAVITNASSNVVLDSVVGITVGMVLFYANTTALVDDAGAAAKVTHVESGLITLSRPAIATVTGANLVFRDDLTFSAVAQEIHDPNIHWNDQIVPNEAAYLIQDGEFHSSVNWVARWGGSFGNSIRVAQCDTANQFNSTLNLGIAANGLVNTSVNSAATNATAIAGESNLTITVTAADLTNAAMVLACNTLIQAAHASLAVDDLVQVGNTIIGLEFLQVSSIGSVNKVANVYSFVIGLGDTFGLASNVVMSSVNRYWEFYNLCDQPPTQSTYVLNFGNTAARDELHVVIVDEDGKFSGLPGSTLEVYKALSRATDAVKADGSTNYYKNVLNQQSAFVWWANDRTTAVSNTAAYVTSSTASAPYNVHMYGGSDGQDESEVSIGALTAAYNLFRDVEHVDVSLVMQGKARGEAVSSNTTLGNYLVENLAEFRKDCVVFVSPDRALMVDNRGEEAADIVTARNNMPSSSYLVIDSGYKRRYDRYNDLYRWTPLNGDIAGLCARTDQTNAPWWSPGGLNRGNIKNVAKLAYNPGKTDRDTLYKNGVNPVVTFPGQGTVLFGDKTALSKPSAFDRINVRRLFIVLEKAISTAAKYMLFEFNDAFTRAQFKAMVNPYLANIQGRRGIYDFLVVCDGTNNTPEIIDSNQFVGDIYIKPARSINFIQLNFIAVGTGIAFNEVVGKFGG